MPDIQIAGAVYPDTPAIDIPKQGGGTARFRWQPELNDVNFFDYDGTLCFSYSAAEFASLTALPPNPTHPGLTAQGWNWTLADAKSQVSAMGKCDIGQCCCTTDGKIHLYIHLESPRLSPYCGFSVNGTATIDWGDGNTSTVVGTSTAQSAVKSTQHTYAAAGDYLITIAWTGALALVGTSATGAYILWNNNGTGNYNRCYQGAIRKVELPSNVILGTFAFMYCYNIESITMPTSATSIGQQIVYNCNSLRYITIPSGCTAIGLNSLGYCRTLRFISIPLSVVTFTVNCFLSDFALQRVVAPKNLTTIGLQAFSSAVGISEFKFPPTLINMTNQNNAFQVCESMQKVELSNINVLPTGMFNQCRSLAEITIPSTVTSMAANSLANCTGLGAIHFKASTPPSAADATVFTSLPTDCIIYVPTGKLSAYTGANNYPSSSIYTYREEA